MADFNTQGTIDWPELDRSLVTSWMDRAAADTTPEGRFVDAMIVLSHYASAWSLHHPLPAGLSGERLEFVNLASLPALQQGWDAFCAHEAVAGHEIDLPLTSSSGEEVPRGVAGRHEVRELGPERYLKVIYQIRLDLVHARLSSDYRDALVARFASGSLELAGMLVAETTPAD